MNSFSIAFKLFKTNIRTYGYYLAVMVFAVAVYYDFMALKHNPEVLKSQELVEYAKIAAQLTSVILLVFMIFFMWYSSSFFLKQRKKEIGIYSLMGISNRKIGFVFAIESIFSGIAAVGAGLLAGILLSKLFIMVLAKAALLDISIKFTVPLSGVRELLITFGVIFLALSVRSYISVARSRLIDLINDSKKDEGAPKFKWVRGIFAALLIGAGYYMSTRVLRTSNYLVAMLEVLIMVIVGTYWLFGAFMPLVMKLLTDRKGILYKGVRIISISNITYRLKGNYRSLAMLTIIAATTITAFGTSLSLRYYVDSTRNIQCPYSFSYISGNEDLNRRVSDAISSSGHELLLEEKIPYLVIPSVKIQDTPVMPSNILAVRYSDFIRVTRELKVKHQERVIEDAKPSGDKVAYIEAPHTIGSIIGYEGKKLTLDGREYVIGEYLKTPLLGDGAASYSCIVVSDERYKAFQGRYKEYTLNGYVVSNAAHSEALGMKLYDMIPKECGLSAYFAKYMLEYSFMGLFYFLGVFMSIVFILSTGSIMYFKLLSEGLADKGKYEVLSKIGVSENEIKKGVSMQVGLSLILPLIIAVFHTLFAINVLEGLLHCDLALPTLAAIIIFAVIYGVYYLVTTRKFLSLIGHGVFR